MMRSAHQLRVGHFPTDAGVLYDAGFVYDDGVPAGPDSASTDGRVTHPFVVG